MHKCKYASIAILLSVVSISSSLFADRNDAALDLAETPAIADLAAADIDLSITDLIGPIQVARGVWLRLDTYITNLGTEDAPGRTPTECPRYTKFYLSTDNIITTDDILIGSLCPNTLAAGATYRWWQDVIIPANTPRGFYYWGAIADATEIMCETDETNNSFSTARVRVR